VCSFGGDISDGRRCLERWTGNLISPSIMRLEGDKVGFTQLFFII